MANYNGKLIVSSFENPDQYPVMEKLLVGELLPSSFKRIIKKTEHFAPPDC
jgi:hypothetical protein